MFLHINVFQEIRILQSKKSNFHELEREREEAIHRLQVMLYSSIKYSILKH